jgi:hypothetical protein
MVAMDIHMVCWVAHVRLLPPSQHTCQAAFRDQAVVLLHYKNIKHVA